LKSLPSLKRNSSIGGSTVNYEFGHIIWIDIKCLEKEWCKQCRYVKFKGIMTKSPVQKQTTQKHVEQLRRKRHWEKN